VVNATVVGGDIVVVEKEAFLHCEELARPIAGFEGDVQRLKLVTGVEISTRPVNRSGNPGSSVKMASRRAAAPTNRAAVRPGVTLAPSIA